MITLPNNWKDGIYVRGWMGPVNSFGSINVLVFSIRNKDGQVYTYQENNQEYPLTDESKKKEVIKSMYNRMIFLLPAIVVQQDTVSDQAGGYSPITNDDWEIFPLQGLKPYKEYTNA